MSLAKCLGKLKKENNLNETRKLNFIYSSRVHLSNFHFQFKSQMSGNEFGMTAKFQG